MLKIALLLCLFALVKGQSSNVEQCTEHTGDLPLNAYVEGCIDPPCRFHQLEDAVIHMVFRAPHNIRRLRSLVTAYLRIGPITMEHHYDLLENAETCNFLTNNYCPVLENEVLMYTLNMFIERIFPVGTQAVLEFRIVDDDSEIVVCLRLAIGVLAPRALPNKAPLQTEEQN